MKKFKGNVDAISDFIVRGWCCKNDGSLADVHVFINKKLRAVFPACNFRPDLFAAKISEFGGFQFDISSLINNKDISFVEVTDESGVLLPNGSFSVCAKDIERNNLFYILGEIPIIKLGVFGHFDYATEVKYGSVLSKIIDYLCIEVCNHPLEADKNIWFAPPTDPKPDGIELINGCFKDSAKSAIDVAHRSVFARGVCVDFNEINSELLYVVKSEDQAAHDGKIMLGSEILPIDIRNKVVQRLIDNRVTPNLVRDIRVPYIGGEIPFAYIKTRNVNERFSNANKSACVTSIEHVFSLTELEQIRSYCKLLRLDYGELDILRDQSDGKIWIVDVNNGPSGPPNGLTKGEVDYCVREMAITFYRKFLT